MAQITVKGTAFSTDAVAGDVYFRTDLGLECYYDGTRWLTAHEYTVDIEEATYSANTSALARKWIGDTYKPYFTNNEWAVYIDTTNDGSNYWTLTFRSQILSQATNTVVSSVATSASSADTWTDLSEDADDQPTTNYGWVYFVALKTGSPGDLTFSATAKYRLIVT